MHSDVVEASRRIRAVPKEIGVFLIFSGVAGILLPGPVGAPLLVLGGAVLWPKAFSGVDRFFHRRFPKTRVFTLRQFGRYLDDLERRYPTGTPSA